MANMFCDNGQQAAREARMLEAQKAVRLQTGQQQINAQFSRFDNNFFKNRRQAYINYAMPQVATQADAAQKGLIYGVTDKGISDSTIADRNQAALNTAVQGQKQAVVDAAFGQENDLRKEVQGQKERLQQQLEASADPMSVSQSAISTANSISTPSVFQPLSNLFNNFATLYYADKVGKSGTGAAPTYNYFPNIAPTGGVTQKGR